MAYEFLEHIATADIAFQVTARTLEQLFADAAAALLNAAVENPASVKPRVERTVELNDVDEEMLLYTFLQMLVYLKDSEQLLLNVETPVIARQQDGRFCLKAIARGEQIDPVRHHLAADVKAVTFHRFELQQTAAGFAATVVLDV